MLNPNQAFLLVEKLEISPKGFTLGVKAELEKIFSICPRLLINAELYGLVLPQVWKKDTMESGRSICNPLGPMFEHLLITWGQTTSQKCSKLAPSFFGPDT
jgi:hypothetical protein